MKLNNIKNYKYKNIVINVIILSILVIFYILIYYFNINMECIFKKITGISCPACGLTRGFNELFHFNLLLATKCNILTIPLFIFIVISVIWILFDILKNKNSYTTNIINFFNKYYIYILVILIVTLIVNNINEI